MAAHPGRLRGMGWELAVTLANEKEPRTVNVGDDEERAKEALGEAHRAWQERKPNESFLIGGRLSVRAGQVVAIELREGGPVIA